MLSIPTWSFRLKARWSLSDPNAPCVRIAPRRHNIVGYDNNMLRLRRGHISPIDISLFGLVSFLFNAALMLEGMLLRVLVGHVSRILDPWMQHCFPALLASSWASMSRAVFRNDNSALASGPVRTSLR